jgi:hypothetical protein
MIYIPFLVIYDHQFEHSCENVMQEDACRPASYQQMAALGSYVSFTKERILFINIQKRRFQNKKTLQQQGPAGI